jgi:protein TonB
MNGHIPLSASRLSESHAAPSGGVILRASRDVPLAPDGPDADLSNVVPFARRRPNDGRDAPMVAIDASTRIAPRWSRRDRIGFALLLMGSVGLHAGLFAYFNRQPEPFASIGVQSISVELVLGDNKAAGLAEKVSPSEEPVNSIGAPEEQKPEDTKTETAQKQPDPVPPEMPVEQTNVQPEIKPTETFKTVAAETKPPELPKPIEPEVARETPPDAKPTQAEPTPEAAQAELAADPKQPEPPAIMAPEPEPKKVAPTPKKEQPVAAKQATKKLRAAKADSDGKDARDRAPPASMAMNASSGVGAGRSDLDTNYPGIVREHLARFKRPMPARLGAGSVTAWVNFGLDRNGGVTSPRLSRATGDATADEEAVAMVRRASPFPPPPANWSKPFAIPIYFDFR